LKIENINKKGKSLYLVRILALGPLNFPPARSLGLNPISAAQLFPWCMRWKSTRAGPPVSQAPHAPNPLPLALVPLRGGLIMLAVSHARSATWSWGPHVRRLSYLTEIAHAWPTECAAQPSTTRPSHRDPCGLPLYSFSQKVAIAPSNGRGRLAGAATRERLPLQRSHCRCSCW
jgi:hypothetical protein